MVDKPEFAKDYQVWLSRSDKFWMGSSIAIGAHNESLIDPAVVDAFISAELALNALLLLAGKQPLFEERLVHALDRCVQLRPELAKIARGCVLLDSRFNDAN